MIIEKMSAIPAKSNPFHHDVDRTGTQINDRFMVMDHSSFPNQLVIVDMHTGSRHKFIFPLPPKTTTEQEATEQEDIVTLSQKQ